MHMGMLMQSKLELCVLSVPLLDQVQGFLERFWRAKMRKTLVCLMILIKHTKNDLPWEGKKLVFLMFLG